MQQRFVDPSGPLAGFGEDDTRIDPVGSQSQRRPARVGCPRDVAGCQASTRHRVDREKTRHRCARPAERGLRMGRGGIRIAEHEHRPRQALPKLGVRGRRCDRALEQEPIPIELGVSRRVDRIAVVANRKRHVLRCGRGDALAHGALPAVSRHATEETHGEVHGVDVARGSDVLDGQTERRRARMLDGRRERLDGVGRQPLVGVEREYPGAMGVGEGDVPCGREVVRPRRLDDVRAVGAGDGDGVVVRSGVDHHDLVDGGGGALEAGAELLAFVACNDAQAHAHGTARRGPCHADDTVTTLRHDRSRLEHDRPTRALTPRHPEQCPCRGAVHG